MPYPHLPLIALAPAVFLCGPAQAQDARLTKAGAVVDALLEIDGREQARLAVEDMLRQTREYEFRAEYEEYFLSLAHASEFRAAKARAFAEAFAENEIDELLALARSPVFRKYQERTPVLMRASRVAFSETLRPKIMEFSQRIEALKQARARGFKCDLTFLSIGPPAASAEIRR